MNENKEILESAFLSCKEKLKTKDYIISDLKFIDYGIQFTISKKNWKSLLRIYANKKGQLKYDYSPIKEDTIKYELINIIDGTDEIVKIARTNSNIDSVDLDFFPLIGTDESGKGDYFGPLVAAGVFVNDKTKTQLEKIGVKDSKKISDDRIFVLADSINRICLNQFSVIEISPEAYNNLYESFQKESKNLNTLLAWGHAKAIEEVLNKVDCSNALSDKFADEKFIISKLQEKGKKITLRQEHKAESNIAVAAASILARARFLERMKKLSIEFGINLSKGVSASVVNQAQQIVKANGFEGLRKVAKLHFKTTDSVIKK